jgi:inner membrane transporter RhtA
MNDSLTKRLAPLLMVGVAVSSNSGSALAVRLFSILGPVGTLWIRSLLAGLILIAAGWRSFHRPTVGQALRLTALGLALAGSNLAFYESLGRIPMGVAATLEFVGPLAIATAGIRRARDVAWPLLAAGGVVLLGDPAVHINLTGFALALTAGAFWAIDILLSKRLVDEVGPVMTLGAAFAISALALTVPAIPAAGPLLHWKVMVAALVVAILDAGLPYLLELFALRVVSASTFSIFASLEPAAAALMGLAILGQHLRPAQLVAVLLVAVASAGASRRTGHASAPEENSAALWLGAAAEHAVAAPGVVTGAGVEGLAFGPADVAAAGAGVAEDLGSAGDHGGADTVSLLAGCDAYAADGPGIGAEERAEHGVCVGTLE